MKYSIKFYKSVHDNIIEIVYLGRAGAIVPFISSARRFRRRSEAERHASTISYKHAIIEV